MKVITIGGPLAAASLSVCLAVLFSTAPSYAINRVIPANPDGGITCANCGTNQQINTNTGNASKRFSEQ
ncbi:MAG TPA: hypothetical protein VGT98_07710 [Candidatus Elarobacter sp.]|nr:hypothetical protein [Candidatus Elarobacter sp.]HEV2740599.1 hypothetical protein [Candidatus Elarobacter sp.]